MYAFNENLEISGENCNPRRPKQYMELSCAWPKLFLSFVLLDNRIICKKREKIIILCLAYMYFFFVKILTFARLGCLFILYILLVFNVCHDGIWCRSLRPVNRFRVCFECEMRKYLITFTEF